LLVFAAQSDGRDPPPIDESQRYGYFSCKTVGVGGEHPDSLTSSTDTFQILIDRVDGTWSVSQQNDGGTLTWDDRGVYTAYRQGTYFLSSEDPTSPHFFDPGTGLYLYRRVSELNVDVEVGSCWPTER
jgi:hypothetical protein